jgi:hypothetical protein
VRLAAELEQFAKGSDKNLVLAVTSRGAIVVRRKV